MSECKHEWSTCILINNHMMCRICNATVHKDLFDELSEARKEIEELVAALTRLRLEARLRGVTLRQFALCANVSMRHMSRWTAKPTNTPPDIVCKGGRQ